MRRNPLRRPAIRLYDRFLGPHEVPRRARRAFRSLRPGLLAVDCGANVGQITELFARRGADVIAFEPNPHAFEVLTARLAGEPRVECIAKAVAASDGTRTLHLHEHAAADEVRWSTGSSLFASKRNVDATRAVEVDAVDLAGTLERLGRRVHVLKLDVEGAEIEILERLLETGLLSEIGHVLVEMHDRGIEELATRGAAVRARLATPAYHHVLLDWM